jgi:hypothetical protein
VSSTATGADGTYAATRLPALATGYTICFDASFATGDTGDRSLASQCYKDVAWNSSDAPPHAATTVPLAPSSVVSHVDAALTPT